MATQWQERRSNKLQRPRRVPLERLIIAAIIFLIVAIDIVIVAVYSQWPCVPISVILSIALAISGLVILSLQVLISFYYPSRSIEETIAPEQSNGKATSRVILGLPPPTYSSTIQQREKVVKEVYAKLNQADVTAIALTGIGGIGKSTLAALIYHYAEKQREAGSRLFTDECLWLKIDASVTMADLAGTLFKALRKPLPDFESLTPLNQATALFKVLNIANQSRLIILDQFENLLDAQTGRALTSRPGIGEWIDAINRKQCTSRVLLTSPFLPQGTSKFSTIYLQEYQVKGLESAEGIALLQRQGVKATDAELRIAVKYCEGHALALILLASLLRDYHISLDAFFKNPIYAKLWVGDIAHNLLDYIYMQRLNQPQRKLLVTFSVYREAMPLSAAQALVDFSAGLTMALMHSALERLLAQHLLQE